MTGRTRRTTSAPKKPGADRPYASPFVHSLKPVRSPKGAPRVVRHNGRPTLVIGKKVIPPFFFFGNPSDEERAKTVFDEIRKAGAAGVHLHILMIEFTVDSAKVQEALDSAAYLLNETLSADPEGHVIFRVVFGGGAGWESKYPNAVFRCADGTPAEPSVCDDGFWGEAERLLGDFVRAIRDLKKADRIIGLHLDRGEWFFADGWGYDTSAAAEEKFREWVRYRYSDDSVALRSAWFDGKVRFETAKIPEFTQYPVSGEGFLRASRKERRWVDYHLFLSDAIVGRIQRLAWQVKSASRGRLLVAVSYGYTLEWSHPASGHLSLGKLLRTREVDIICGPPSYRDRRAGGAAPFPSPIDSFALNGKLFISEEDFKTPMAAVAEPDDFNPVMETPQELEAAHWRGVGAALAHSAGIAWMDLWGNGWLNTSAIWTRAERARKALICAMAAPPKDPDVAVLIDERSLAYLSDARAFKQLIQDAREAVLRAGVSAGFYLLSDLAHRTRFPEAKLYIFLNAWDIRPEVRASIKDRLQRDGKTLFWVYSAGLFESGRPALERVREVTGIAIRPQPLYSHSGTAILNRKHPLTEPIEQSELSTAEQLEPSYFAIPEEGCTVLGEYIQTGLPSLVVREIASGNDPARAWRTVFLGEPVITERIIQGLCNLAGVQIWNHNGDVVHLRPPFLAVHYSGSGHRIATLPDRWHAFDLTREKMIGSDSAGLQSETVDGATTVLLIGEEAEVQELVNLDTERLLTLDELPEPEQDTVEQEDLDLEVPIMPLPDADEFLSILADTIEEVPEERDVPTAPKQRGAASPGQRKRAAPRKRRATKTREDAQTVIGVTFREKG
ncbi:MAG: hypothetical protein IH851_04280 [Armatimonadetes bacterium]|nr:hypothetical protein [Armatimonadota bacterium]